MLVFVRIERVRWNGSASLTTGTILATSSSASAFFRRLAAAADSAGSADSASTSVSASAAAEAASAAAAAANDTAVLVAVAAAIASAREACAVSASPGTPSTNGTGHLTTFCLDPKYSTNAPKSVLSEAILLMVKKPSSVAATAWWVPFPL